MKRIGLIILFSFLYCFCANGQNEEISSNGISGYVYWFDNDISSLNSIITNNDSVINIVSNLDASVLNVGVHTLNYRFQDKEGMWSSVLTHYFYKIEGIPQAADANLSQVEYWLDNSGTKHTQSISSSNTFTLSESLYLDTISTGVHHLNIRFKDDQDQWTSIQTHYFYKIEGIPQAADANLSQVEYWLDNSETKHTQSISSSNTFTLSESLYLDTISTGVHHLNIRFKDDQDQWTSIQTHYFYKIEGIPQAADANLSQVEYWLDNSETKHTQSISSSNTFTLSESLYLDTISTGVHHLNIRFKDDQDQWTSIQTHYFYKIEGIPQASDANLSQIEYWLDNSGTKHTQSISSSNTFTLSESLNLDTISTGVHHLNIRFKDDQGQWTSILTHYFYKVEGIPQASDANLSQLTYWFDNDTENRYKTDIDSGNTYTFLSQINLSNINSGVHTFNCYFSDDQGQSSSVMSHLFYKLYDYNPEDNDNAIVAYRIIYDNDANLVQNYSLSDNTDNPLLLNVSIPAPLLVPGEHIIAVQFKDQIGMWSSAFCDTIVTDTIPQTIEFKEGWNLFSLSVNPNNNNLQVIVQALIDNDKLVKVQDESGAAIEVMPGLDSWTNNIGDWQTTEGYRINVNTDTLLRTYGHNIELPLDIPLSIGWNIISYPAVSAQSSLGALDSLIASGNLVKVQNESGKAIERIPGTDIWNDRITYLVPGEGYKVYVDNADTLTISDGVEVIPMTTQLKSTVEEVTPKFYHTIWKGNGYNHMNIYVKNSCAEGRLFYPGDEIAVYDQDRCVGVSVVSHLDEEYISLIASADDPATEEIDGFVAGNKITLKVWCNSKELVINNFEPTPIDISGFEPEGSVMLNLAEISTNVMISNTEYRFRAYPNPFKDHIYLECQLPHEMTLFVKVSNIAGKSIYMSEYYMLSGQQTIEWNTETLNGDMIPLGVYLINIYSNDQKVNQVFKVIKQ